VRASAKEVHTAQSGKRGGGSKGHERSERKEGVSFCGGSGRASAKKACPSAAEAGERAQRRSVLLRRKRASEREEGVSFCGGKRLAQRAQRRSGLLRRKRASEREEGVCFCGRSRLSERKEGVSFCGGKRLAQRAQRRRVLLRRKEARSTKEWPSAAEAGSLGGCHPPNPPAAALSHSLPLGGCRGKTPRP
jgi:hypothetical protein